MHTQLSDFARLLRSTPHFHDIDADLSPVGTILEAANRTNMAMRLPLHHRYLRKQRPKEASYDHVTQLALGLLTAYAYATGAKQVIVRLAHDGQLQAISFQPRPYGVGNWTREHSISPAKLWDNDTDPFVAPPDALRSASQVMDISTRAQMHMAGKLARTVHERMYGPRSKILGATATIQFGDGQIPPPPRLMARMVYRSTTGTERIETLET